MNHNQEVKNMTKKPFTALKFHSGIQLRAFPSSKQKIMIQKNSGVQRSVYNEHVARNKKRYCLEHLGVLNFAQSQELTLLKKTLTDKDVKQQYAYMQEKMIDSLSIMNGRRFYQQAWHNFKKNQKFSVPNFHKKMPYTHVYQTNCLYGTTVTVPNLFVGSVRFVNKNTLQVPKLGKIKIAGSHQHLLKLKQDIQISTVTIRILPTGKTYISLQLGSEKPFKITKKAPKNTAIGIDLNLTNFCTLSDGTKVENPRYYRKQQQKLARMQRKLSKRFERAKKEKRPLKTSRNYQQQRQKVALLHEKIRQQRQNFLQQLSTKLVKNHDLLVVEELRSKNMLKNRKLSKSISDVGWKSFLNMLNYKSVQYQTQLIFISPRYTTQTCSHCGYCKDKTSKGGLQTLAGDSIQHQHNLYTCYQCGFVQDRDQNAALNILHKGLQGK